MLTLAVDPGPVQSGWCLFGDGKVYDSGIESNEVFVSDLVKYFTTWEGATLAIEMIASYGMPVGREVFDTCRWIGRFQQAWHSPDEVQLIYRRDVKQFLCNSAKAKDANVWQALVDLLGAPGSKKLPGPTYGVKSHARAALAVAVTAQRWGQPV